MELHGYDDPKIVEVIRKLKRNFYLVNLHFNNWSCTPKAAPLPAWAYQVHWVNRRHRRARYGAARPRTDEPAECARLADVARLSVAHTEAAALTVHGHENIRAAGPMNLQTAQDLHDRRFMHV